MKVFSYNITKPIMLILYLILTFTYIGCKKYPEDKFISLRKPENRVVGTWKIKEYNFNGYRIMHELNTKLKTFDIRDLSLIVTGKDGKILPKYHFAPSFIGYGGDIPMSDKTKFRFIRKIGQNDFGDSIQKLLFFTPQSFIGTNYTNWDIRNLFKDKMHLQLKTDTGNYDIYFEK